MLDPTPDLPALVPRTGLRMPDVWLLLLICAALLGWGAFSGRPLSMHESRLPQLAREMVQGQSSYILPQSGGRPWLERPPLPHWFTAGSMLLFGRTDAEWVARLPAALMGTSIVLMGAWIAGVWFGRSLGLLSGVTLATTYELYNYSSLAEDDIYLAAVAVAAMAMFVKAEQSNAAYKSFFSRRAWPILLMFALIGLTNWVKGPLVGAVPLIGTIGLYLLLNADRTRWRRYLWPWGILLFILLAVAWPLLALHRYPDVWDNWKYDFTGHLDAAHDEEFDHPIWYYPAMMPMILAPWVWAVIPGLIVTAKRAWHVRASPERLLWCWAWVGLIVLSLPARKHHHYFLPIIVPWVILAAQGLVPVARYLFAGHGPAWSRRPSTGLLFFGLPGVIAIFFLRGKIAAPPAFPHLLMPLLLAATWLFCVWLFYAGQLRKSGYWVMGSVVVGYIVVAGWLQACVISRDHATLMELQFLHQVSATVPPGQLLTIDAAVSPLEFFRLQYYLPDDARLIQNLSFLRSDQIKEKFLYVVARANDQLKLQQLGDVQIVLKSIESYGTKSPQELFTLFHITYSPNALRAPPPPYVSVLQAMGRRPGPWCGGEW